MTDDEFRVVVIDEFDHVSVYYGVRHDYAMGLIAGLILHAREGQEVFSGVDPDSMAVLDEWEHPDLPPEYARRAALVRSALAGGGQ